MKVQITILLLTLSSLTIFAQPPQAFNYQAVYRDDNGNIMGNKAIDVRLSVLEATVNGTVVYRETHADTTNEQGLITLAIGEGNVVSGSFASIDWGNNDYFLQVEVDALDGNGYRMMGTSQLLSVPYALYAGEAGSAGVGSLGQAAESYYGSGFLFISANDTTYEAIPGLDSISINVPQDMTVLLQTTGSAYLTSFNALSSMRVALFVDGTQPSIGAEQSLKMVSDDNLSSGGSIWSIFYPVNLSAGVHSISVKAKSGSLQNQSSITIDNGGFFDHSELNVIYLRQ